MRHVTHTLHIARCTLRSPPSCKRAEWRVRVRVHAVRCRSCPRCALHVYMSTELVCFPVLTCCSLTRAASNVCYRIAAISHGLPFCFLFRFVWFLFFWVAFCGLTSATRQPIAIVLWVWGADSLRASFGRQHVRGSTMWRHVANWWCIAWWSLICNYSLYQDRFTSLILKWVVKGILRLKLDKVTSSFAISSIWEKNCEEFIKEQYISFAKKVLNDSQTDNTKKTLWNHSSWCSNFKESLTHLTKNL